MDVAFIQEFVLRMLQDSYIKYMCERKIEEKKTTLELIYLI